jgi:hypothetical protein
MGNFFFDAIAIKLYTERTVSLGEQTHQKSLHRKGARRLVAGSYLFPLTSHFVSKQEPTPYAFNLRYDEVNDHGLDITLG